jgi:hypothetical protein
MQEARQSLSTPAIAQTCEKKRGVRVLGRAGMPYLQAWNVHNLGSIRAAATGKAREP